MGTDAAAMQLSLLATQERVEPTRASSPSRAKRQTKPPAVSLKTAQPAPNSCEVGFVERRSVRSRRPPGFGGRRATDRVEACPLDAARSVALATSAALPNAPLPPENELWDLRAAARFLKMSTSWVYKRVEDGILPVTRVNGYSLRFDPAALREWVAKNGSARRPVKRKTN
jgi:predicted DNA-binding transcriptional regulator AlpA